MTEASPGAEPGGKSLAGILNALSLILILAALARWNALETGEILWLAGFVIMLGVRLSCARESLKQRTLHAVNHAGELSLITVLATTMILPLIYLATGFPAALDYRLPHFFSVTGAVLLAVSLWLFWRAHADLSRYWSPGLEIQQGHRLVTGGVYRRIRHPMYAAVFGAALAQPLLLQNFLAGPPVIAAIVLFLVMRIPVEERMMHGHFGAQWHDYAATSGCLLPRLFSASR